MSRRDQAGIRSPCSVPGSDRRTSLTHLMDLAELSRYGLPARPPRRGEGAPAWSSARPVWRVPSALGRRPVRRRYRRRGAPRPTRELIENNMVLIPSLARWQRLRPGVHPAAAIEPPVRPGRAGGRIARCRPAMKATDRRRSINGLAPARTTAGAIPRRVNCLAIAPAPARRLRTVPSGQPVLDGLPAPARQPSRSQRTTRCAVLLWQTNHLMRMASRSSHPWTVAGTPVRLPSAHGLVAVTSVRAQVGDTTATDRKPFWSSASRRPHLLPPQRARTRKVAWKRILGRGADRVENRTARPEDHRAMPPHQDGEGQFGGHRVAIGK